MGDFWKKLFGKKDKKIRPKEIKTQVFPEFNIVVEQPKEKIKDVKITAKDIKEEVIKKPKKAPQKTKNVDDKNKTNKPYKPTVQERVKKVKRMTSIEKLEKTIKYDKSKTVQKAADERIKELKSK